MSPESVGFQTVFFRRFQQHLVVHQTRFLAKTECHYSKCPTATFAQSYRVRGQGDKRTFLAFTSGSPHCLEALSTRPVDSKNLSRLIHATESTIATTEPDKAQMTDQLWPQCFQNSQRHCRGTRCQFLQSTQTHKITQRRSKNLLLFIHGHAQMSR